MSNYKTPIRIHVSSTRQVSSKIGKYKLPFRKDQPPQDNSLAASQIINSSFLGHLEQTDKAQTEAKKTKQDSSSEKKEQNQTLKESTVKQKSIKEEVSLEENQSNGVFQSPLIKQQPSPPQTPQQQNQQNPQNPQQTQGNSLPQKLSNRQSKPSSAPFQLLRVKDIPKLKPKILYEQPQQKQPRYQSVVSQYEQQINFADKSLNSDAELIIPKRVQSEKESKEELLPLIKPQRKIAHNSSKKEQNKAWKTLSQELEQARAQSLNRQPPKKRKRSNSNKFSKWYLGRQQQQNECLIIQTELKRLNRDKTDLQSQNKDDIYTDLPPIPEDAAQISKNKQKRNGFLQKLKQAIELQQQNKLNKLKFPLEHYVENYYKIRQINPFFRKLNELAGCIILSIGKLKIVDSGHQIYTEGQPLTHIYINVVGKIFITNNHKSFKKFTLTGETLAEEALFEEGKSYSDRLVKGSRPMFHREEARSLSRVCLLRIKLQKYYKMSNQLCSMGYKNLFVLIDNLFRINYFKKQSLLHGQTQPKDRLQTEALLNHRHKASYFFH